MKWLLTFCLLFDCIYQLYAEPTSVSWSIYYDLVHNLFVFSVALWAALKIYEMKTISYVFIVYYAIISLNEISKFGLTPDTYWAEKGYDGFLQGWSYLALTITVAIVIINKWKVKEKK